MGARAGALVSTCWEKNTNPMGGGEGTLTIASNPNHLPKASPPNTITLGGGVRASTREFGETANIQSTCTTWKQHLRQESGCP